jgi:hypothetical protein
MKIGGSRSARTHVACAHHGREGVHRRGVLDTAVDVGVGAAIQLPLVVVVAGELAVAAGAEAHAVLGLVPVA